MRDVIRVALTAHGIQVISVDSVAAATRAVAERTDVAGVLVDVHLRDGSGIEFYHWLVANRPSIAPCVAFVTGGGPLAARVSATGRQVLEKPFELSEVIRLATDWHGTGDTAQSDPAATV